MNEIKSGLREALRTAVIAIIPLVTIQLQTGSLDYKVLLIAGLIGLLKGVETWLHKNDIKTGLEFGMIK